MFKDALIASHTLLNSIKESQAGFDFALIGAHALSLYSQPRATADIDYAIKPGNARLQRIASALNGTAHQGDIYDPLAGSVSFKIPSNIGDIPIQCIQFHPSLESIVFDNIRENQFHDIALRAPSAPALILLKLYAGSALDIEDAKKIIDSGTLDEEDLKYLKTKAGSLRISARLKKSFKNS